MSTGHGHDPNWAESPTDLCEAIGGPEICHRMATAFYARVGKDPALRHLFPGKTLRCATEEFAAFLVQFLGGPSEETQHRWWLSLRDSHRRFKIGPAERDAWLANMLATLDEVPISDSVRATFRTFFEEASAYLVNRDAANVDSASCPVAAGWFVPARALGEELASEHRGGFDRSVRSRWEVQAALDRAVDAVRAGDAEQALALIGGPPLHGLFREQPSMFAGLVSLLISSDSDPLRQFARKAINDPRLIHERYGGKTLLHFAAIASSLEFVELLIRLGADPKAPDASGHPPLYYLANGRQGEFAREAVLALIQGGAQVNVQTGVKHCSALHMAARRDNLGVAEALLDCGADIEARDSQRDTPLRRAVNCGATNVARLLVSSGANVHSVGSKGLSPITACRSENMRRILNETVARPVSP